MATTELAMSGYQGTMYTQLPLLGLKSQPRYCGMPKRYDDTKPVAVQNFSHQRIIDIGNKLHKETFERYEVEKLQAMKAVEEAVWAKAEVEKQALIAKALKKATSLHEREIKKLVKAQEKTLKEAIMKVEQEMEQLAREELKKQRADHENHLKEVVESIENRRLAEKLEAVKQARQEEKQMAQTKYDKMVKEFTEQLDKVQETYEVIKQDALTKQEKKLLQERETAIQKARVEEQAISDERLVHQKNIHEQNNKVMHTKIMERKSEISQLHNKIAALERQRERVIDELFDTRKSYQMFIDGCTPMFEKGEAEFVMPPLRSVTII